MSDYGDDYSDYGDEWMYVEDEFMAADDLAEHVVASPPPTSYGDDDMVEEWDRFDYFNDLEYASDGYDDAKFLPRDVKGAQAGQKRKRAVTSSSSSSSSKKKRKTVGDALGTIASEVVAHSPVVWRSQNDRAPTRRLLDDKAPSYALLSDWRSKLADTPRWARGSPQPLQSPSAQSGITAASALEEEAPADGEDMEEGLNISQDALMAALQKQLAAAGGPLSGMDPQQLLQFAMRMATDQDAGDDIAGEMAEAMLEGDEEEDDGTAEENLLSWVAKQRNANKDSSASEPKSPEAARDSKQPPTPPSSEANRSVKAAPNNSVPSDTQSSRKRKADEEVEGDSSTKTTKKRATRSFDAPTAASQARTAPARTTRTTRAKR
ncbi:hypothetical protein CC86DRAFT_470510 [Ophiobolus disseminans]|uniref:Uncharacterized protein n=1 Tax=Ophiobolus disseminans TaxID=1469910 RepID=A0A6A6ZL90_9PLEO|nr:hypothetical protein CC86DRAFT_470510 [Ophiobolus disseminans]